MSNAYTLLLVIMVRSTTSSIDVWAWSIGNSYYGLYMYSVKYDLPMFLGPVFKFKFEWFQSAIMRTSAGVAQGIYRADLQCERVGCTFKLGYNLLAIPIPLFRYCKCSQERSNCNEHGSLAKVDSRTLSDWIKCAHGYKYLSDFVGLQSKAYRLPHPKAGSGGTLWSKNLSGLNASGSL